MRNLCKVYPHPVVINILACSKHLNPFSLVMKIQIYLKHAETRKNSMYFCAA